MAKCGGYADCDDKCGLYIEGVKYCIDNIKNVKEDKELEKLTIRLYGNQEPETTIVNNELKKLTMSERIDYLKGLCPHLDEIT